MVRLWRVPEFDEQDDALGSVRQTLDDAGAPLSASGLVYTPFGVPQRGATRDQLAAIIGWFRFYARGTRAPDSMVTAW